MRVRGRDVLGLFVVLGCFAGVLELAHAVDPYAVDVITGAKCGTKNCQDCEPGWADDNSCSSGSRCIVFKVNGSLTFQVCQRTGSSSDKCKPLGMTQQKPESCTNADRWHCDCVVDKKCDVTAESCNCVGDRTDTGDMTGDHDCNPG